MTNNEKYFVSLLSAFLNQTAPALPDNADWNEIYRLAEIHSVTAIIAASLSKLPKKHQPAGKLYSAFRQQLGYTVMNYNDKMKAYRFVKDLLIKNDIDYLFVKGIVLCDLYPSKELRASGDIDVIIKDSCFDRLLKILNDNAIEITDCSAVCITFKYNNIFIEVHSNLYSDHKYFENIFELADKNGPEYTLKPETHLLYVLCHIIKHFNMCGAGIKMFLDIDILVRHLDHCIDYTQFFSVCKDLNINIFAKSAFSLCNYWFSTPKVTDYDITKDEKILNLFEKEILSGGSFGFEKRDLGNYYVAQGIGSGENNDIKAKIRAFGAFVFPKKEYLRSIYPYAKKHNILLPVAWSERIFKGVFLRNKHSWNTLSSILNSDESSARYKKLLNELDI